MLHIHTYVFVFVANRAYIGGTSAPQGSVKELKHNEEKDTYTRTCLHVRV